MRIIDNRIRDLVHRIDEAREHTPAVDKLIAQLVFRIHVACLQPAIVARAASYNGTDFTQQNEPNLSTNFPFRSSTIGSFGTSAKVVEPLPDIIVIEAPFSFRNS